MRPPNTCQGNPELLFSRLESVHEPPSGYLQWPAAQVTLLSILSINNNPLVLSKLWIMNIIARSASVITLSSVHALVARLTFLLRPHSAIEPRTLMRTRWRSPAWLPSVLLLNSRATDQRQKLICKNVWGLFSWYFKILSEHSTRHAGPLFPLYFLYFPDPSSIFIWWSLYYKY